MATDSACKRTAKAVLRWSSDLEFGHALKAEAVPNIAEEVAAFGFCTQEEQVVIVGKLEVSVDVAASESQVQDALVGIVSD